MYWHVAGGMSETISDFGCSISELIPHKSEINLDLIS